MKLPKRYWFVVILGITVFLAAFAVAFAATWFQGSQVVPSAVNVQTTVVISGDQMFALWRDEAMTEPVISGDGPHITFLKVETEPPRRQINFVRTPPIFIQNVSSTFARPIEPCHEVIIGGQPVGAVSAHLRTLGSTDQERGNTCDDSRIGEMMSPGEKWTMHINLELKQPLPEGGNFFDLVIGGIGMTGDVPTPIEPPAGMVSWWPGDGNASDIIGGNHGTLQGSATFTTGGKVGQAFSFDGASGTRVSINDIDNLRFAGSFTFDAWVNTTSIGTQSGSVFAADVLRKRHRDDGGLMDIGIGMIDNVARFFLVDDTGNFAVIQGATIINDGQWHHIAGVRDSSAGEARLFVDGVLEASLADTTGTFLEVNSVLWNIGNTPGNGTIKFPWDGLIDEVEIFNRALSEAEIMAIFDAGSAGKRKPSGIAPPAGMVSWWPGDGNASDIIDGNSGTLTGDATFTDGMVGQAFSLDGTGDVVVVPDSPSLNLTGDVTVDMWARRTVIVRGHMIAKGAGTIGTTDAPDVFLLAFDSEHRLFGGFERADGTNVILEGPVVTDTNFHHYAYVRSGNSHKLFMDGVMVTGNTFTGSPGDTSGIELAIGSVRHDPAPTGFSQHFAGIIDEVEIFNRALSAAEIRAIFEAGSAGKRKP